MNRAHTFYTFTTSFVILGLGFINSIILARVLGAEGRGEVAAAMLWPGLFIYLGSLGLFPAITYYAAQKESNLTVIFSNAFLFGILQSLIIIPLGYWMMPKFLASQSSEVVNASRLFLLSFPLGLLTQYSMNILQSQLYMKVFNLIRLITPIGYLGGVILLFLGQRLTLIYILWLQIGLGLASLIMAVVALFWLCPIRPFQINLLQAKTMLRYGLKVQFGTISQLANLRLDQALISAFMPSTQLGLYVTAVSMSSLGQLLPTALRLVITPVIAQKATVEEGVTTLVTAFRNYWIISLVSFVVLFLTMPALIPFVYGKEFVEAIYPTLFLLAATLFLGAKEVLSGGLQGLGEPWLVSKSEIISLVITALSLLILLPTWGIMGAAIATLLAYFVSLLVLVNGLRGRHNISPILLFQLEKRDVQNLAENLRKMTTSTKDFWKR